MMARAGSFPPSLVQPLILVHSRPRDIVLDPFCGKGTAVLQAALDERRGIGSDVAPDAVLVSRAKIAPVTLPEVEEYLSHIEDGRLSIRNVPPDVKVFFHNITLSRLLYVRDCLLKDCTSRSRKTRRLATFLLGVLLGILHGHASYSLSLPCSHVYAMAPNYVRKYAREHGLTKPVRDVRKCLKEKSKRLLSADPVPNNGSAVYKSSAHKYSFNRNGWLTGRVDLIVTSPPYLNAQTYAKDARLRLWLLGYDFRQLRPQYIHTGSVSTYKRKMAPCVGQMLHVLRPQASAFLIAGDVFITKRGKKQVVRTGDVIAEVAEGLEPEDDFKFQVVDITEDQIPAHSRYYSSIHKDAHAEWNADGNGTGVRIDRIVHLRKVPVK